MNKEELIKLKQELRDLHLRQILTGEIQGPITGHASIDKPWLKFYTKEQIKTNMPKMTAYQYLYQKNNKYLGRTALSYFSSKIT